MNKESKQLLNFLKKQNQLLKDDIKDLKQILRLNKQALQVSLTYRKQQNFDKSIPQLIKLLYDENSKLHSRIDELRSEIQTGMCNALISEQIAFESTSQEILLTNELKDKLQKMRKELESKEKKIIELTKINIDQKNNTFSAPNNLSLQAIKLVEYCDVNKVTKKLKDSIQKLNQEMDFKKQQIQRLKDGKQELMKLNLILTKQLNELKLLTSCQTTKSNNQMSLELSNNDLTKYLRYQKKLINEEENIYEGDDKDSDQNSSSQVSDSDSSEIDQFPSEEEYNQNEKQYILDEQKQESKANHSMQSIYLGLKDKSLALNPKPKLNITLNLGNLGLQKMQPLSKGEEKMKMNIPKLELAKAKQIQNLIVKKINNDEKKKKQGGNQPVKEEKYKKLQEELENLRKKMGNEIMEKLAVERQCNFLKKIVTELEERNNILVERKVMQQEEEKYEKKRNNNYDQNIQTLLDICRDVTLNKRLRRVVLGQENLPKRKDIESLSI